MYFAKGRALPLTPSCPTRQLKISQRCPYENHTSSSSIWKTAKPHQVKNNMLLIHTFLYNINTILDLDFIPVNILNWTRT